MINQANINRYIWVISIGIPVVILALFQVNLDYSLPFLPYFYTAVNAVTLLCILSAFYLIKRGDRKNHERLMTTALFLSIIFLLSYLLYHAGTNETRFGGEGMIRYIYFFLLIFHIMLSVIFIPLVLITFLRAKLGEFEKHRILARITIVIWTYVLISGILVFLLIRPYY